MNKEETMLRKRLIELSNQAYQRDVVSFSDFLNLNELNILHTTPKDMFPARYETYGGYDLSERQMVAFLPDALYYDYGYPMQIIEIKPLNAKFSEELSHRDYLGSLMNLGIERNKMGDILLMEDRAVLFIREENIIHLVDLTDYCLSENAPAGWFEILTERNTLFLKELIKSNWQKSKEN